MNIQASNIGFNLPITNKSANTGQKLLSEPATGSAQAGSDPVESSSRNNSIETLKKAIGVSLISRETDVQQTPIQAYLDNASLANQAERDELHQLLGIDFFV
ncbi:MAG: hypothetical protein COB26_11645 [Piscirickettsiaceae bacterium]|nr:MAG: hypothetical protein COB26_11645 [Piscirickettsiaceae bacterium]